MELVISTSIGSVSWLVTFTSMGVESSTVTFPVTDTSSGSDKFVTSTWIGTMSLMLTTPVTFTLRLLAVEMLLMSTSISMELVISTWRGSDRLVTLTSIGVLSSIVISPEKETGMVTLPSIPAIFISIGTKSLIPTIPLIGRVVPTGRSISVIVTSPSNPPVMFTSSGSDRLVTLTSMGVVSSTVTAPITETFTGVVDVKLDMSTSSSMADVIFTSPSVGETRFTFTGVRDVKLEMSTSSSNVSELV